MQARHAVCFRSRRSSRAAVLLQVYLDFNVAFAVHPDGVIDLVFHGNIYIIVACTLCMTSKRILVFIQNTKMIGFSRCMCSVRHSHRGV
jgi:hypothetical protein